MHLFTCYKCDRCVTKIEKTINHERKRKNRKSAESLVKTEFIGIKKPTEKSVKCPEQDSNLHILAEAAT